MIGLQIALLTSPTKRQKKNTDSSSTSAVRFGGAKDRLRPRVGVDSERGQRFGDAGRRRSARGRQAEGSRLRISRQSPGRLHGQKLQNPMAEVQRSAS